MERKETTLTLLANMVDGVVIGDGSDENNIAFSDGVKVLSPKTWGSSDVVKISMPENVKLSFLDCEDLADAEGAEDLVCAKVIHITSDAAGQQGLMLIKEDSHVYSTDVWIYVKGVTEVAELPEEPPQDLPCAECFHRLNRCTIEVAGDDGTYVDHMTFPNDGSGVCNTICKNIGKTCVAAYFVSLNPSLEERDVATLPRTCHDLNREYNPFDFLEGYNPMAMCRCC